MQDFSSCVFALFGLFYFMYFVSIQIKKLVAPLQRKTSLQPSQRRNRIGRSLTQRVNSILVVFFKKQP